MEAAGSVAQAGTGWALVSENSIFSGACRQGDVRVVAGIRGALGSEPQLLAGHDIDFYQKALQAPVSGQAWGPESWAGCQGAQL